jgi:WD40 repeat protein
MPSRFRDSSLVILLGAHDFPFAPSLRSTEAFSNSYSAVKDYFIDPDGFGLGDPENMLDLFDSELNSVAICRQIKSWLELKLDGVDPSRVTDVFVYYVGHGGFGREDRSYYLALKQTESYDPYTHSLQLHSLATLLRTYAGALRRYLILDSCFAAAAIQKFQSPLNDVVKETIGRGGWSEGINDRGDLPAATRGTSLLCASSSDQAAIFGDKYTRFSEALIASLREGDRMGGRDLSLRNLQRLTWAHMHRAYGEEAVHPEVHSPDQRGAYDIADEGIFPNPAIKPVTATSESLRTIGVLRGHKKHVDCVGWSSDGNLLASGAYDNKVCIWRAGSWELVRELRGHTLGVSGVAWSPGQETVASVSYDKTARLWSARTGDCLATFEGHRDQIRALAFSRNGRLLATGAQDSDVVIWDVPNQKRFRKHSLKNHGWINALALKLESGLLAVGLGDGFVALQSTIGDGARQPFKAHRNYVNALAWMPGQGVLCSGADDGLIRLWDVGDDEVRMEREIDEHDSKILRLSFSTDGRWLASLGEDRLIVWRCRDWTPAHTIDGPFPTKTYLPLAFAPVGTTLAAADPVDPTAVQLIDLGE